jgi:hypothetical protein
MLTIPGHKGMPLKTTLRFHLTCVRIATIKNTLNNKCWQECIRKGTLILCWWKWKLVQPLLKTIWRLLKKLKIHLPYDPAIPLLGIYLKDCELAYNKRTAHPCLLQHYSTTAKLWKEPRCPTTDE